ncbi:MAG: phosphoribosyltransferase domain-containing protein, partial [Pseudonocardiaceae bacterium]
MGCDEWAQLLATDWGTHELGARLVARHGELHDQVGLAVRVNPRRAHLLVSSVLGKYIPMHPGSACWAGTTLGRQVARCLGGSECSPLVVGYAETATALGHGAKFYPHLAQADPSNHYLDAISAHFG